MAADLMAERVDGTAGAGDMVPPMPLQLHGGVHMLSQQVSGAR